MSKKILKVLLTVTFALLLISRNPAIKAFAETQYGEYVVHIRLNYNDFQYAEVVMPSDGYIIISHEETMVSIGIDSNKEFDAKRILGEGTYKVNLKKGTHKIYLFEGAGVQFFENEYARIHYSIYIKESINGNREEIRQSGDYQYYVIDDQSCGIKFYKGKDEKIKVPTEIEGYKVTVIGEKAFAGKNIEQIVISKFVQEIGYKAFWGCENLYIITFESGSKLQDIGDTAFLQCKKLKKIIIPKNVKRIQERAFSDCGSLSEITFESGSKLQNIEEKTFSKCKKLKKIVIPKSVKKIEEGAFIRCENLSVITFESSSKLQSIGEETFLKCKRLKKIILTSKRIKSIEESAIYGINKKAVIKVPHSKFRKYKTLLNKKVGFKSSMKIKSIG